MLPDIPNPSHAKITESEYKPGLHLISEIKSTEDVKLRDALKAHDFFNERISFYGLNKVGEVYHQFNDAGFTAVICLTESHIAIHTWPEFNRVTFDVFLSNYSTENDDKCRMIHKDILDYFDAHSIVSNELIR